MSKKKKMGVSDGALLGVVAIVAIVAVTIWVATLSMKGTFRGELEDSEKKARVELRGDGVQR